MRRATLMGLTLGSIIIVCGGIFLWNVISVNRQKAQISQAITDILNQSNRDVEEMRAVINSHSQGADRTHAMASAVPAMAAKLQAIDTTQSPSDFQQTFLHYRQAWQAVGDKLAQLPQSDLEVLSQAMNTAIFGDGPRKQDAPLDAQNEALRAAANDLEALALHYGVQANVSR